MVAFRALQENQALRLTLLVLGLTLVGLVAGGLLAVATPAILFAAVAGVIVGLALLSSTQYSLLALIAVATLLPFAAVPLPIGFAPTFLDGALLTFFVGWLARLVTKPEERLLSTPVHGPLLAFVGLCIVSFFLSQGVTQNVARYFVEILLAMALYFGVVNTVRERRQVEILVWAIIGAGTLAAGLGIVLYYLPNDTTVWLLSTLRVLNYPAGAGVLRFINDDPSLTMRATSTSIDPNVLGGLLMLISALTIPQLFRGGSLTRRGLLLPVLAVLGWCLLLTLSRGSWVGLAAALVFVATIKYRRMWLLLIVLAAGVYFLPEAEAYVAHLISGVQLQDKAAAMRIGEYTDALKLIAQYPVFGIGFGQSPTIDLYLGVSNVYLLIAEETGLVGLAAYAMALGALVLTGWRTLRQLTDPGLQALLMGLLAALAGAMTAGIFDHYFFNLVFPHMTAIFWLLAGLAMAIVRLNEGDPAWSPPTVTVKQ